MFQKSLTDIVKGIRNHKKDEDGYVRGVLKEIREELSNPKMSVKLVATQKLTYLHMMGWDCSWAAFHVIEVMSDSRFAMKRVGYLAASLSFQETSDILLLTTNLFKKDVTSNNQYDAGVALTCLSKICTPDLARDLSADVLSLLTCSRAYVRRKSILTLYRIFLAFPDALRPSFPKLKEKLDDSDQGVISAAVNVICELARRNPSSYLSLAPILFKLLTTLSSNWTLIKIVKLFGVLTPLEPRLGKKLIEPLSHIISTTTAKSLLFECVNTVTKGMTKHIGIMKLCVEKLRELVLDTDQNLKYLGLLGLANVMTVYPRMVVDLKEPILDCLSDTDVTIRRRAVDLICGMASKRSIMEIVRRLIQFAHTSESENRNEVVMKIIELCSQDNYRFITDFEWYVQTLVQLTEIPGVSVGRAIASQLLDVCVRVPSVREAAVLLLSDLLNAPYLADDVASDSELFEVLYASAWIIGEFASSVEDDEDLDRIVNSLLKSKVVSLPAHIQGVYVQASLKVYTLVASRFQSPSDSGPNLLSDEPESEELSNVRSDNSGVVTKIRNAILGKYGNLRSSIDVEVQERTTSLVRILELHGQLLETGLDIADELAALFDEELNPISAKAQSKVPVPDGLDLDEPLGELDYMSDNSMVSEHSYEAPYSPDMSPLVDTVQPKKLKGSTPFYLPSASGGIPNVDEIPTVKLTDNDLGLEEKRHGGKKRRNRRKNKNKGPVVVRTVEVMPEGAEDSDKEEDKVVKKDALDVDLTLPLADDEKLPTLQAYKRQTAEEARQAYEKMQAEQEEKRKKERAQRQEEKEKKKKDRDSKDERHKHRHHRHKHKHSSHKETRGKEKKETKTESRSVKVEKTVEKKVEKEDDVLLDLLGGAPASEPTSTRSPTRQKDGAPAGYRFASQVLGKDDKLEVSWNTQVRPSDGSSLTLPFSLRNLTSDPSHMITNIQVMLSDTDNIRVFRQDSHAPIQAPFVLQQQETRVLHIQTAFKSFRRPHRITGGVTFSFGIDEFSITFEMVIPIWIFFYANAMTREIFESYWAHSELKRASGLLSVGKRSYQDMVKELVVLWRVHFVDGSDGVCLLAGRSVHGHDLFVMAKSVGDKSLSVDIRCTEERLASGLLEDANAFFAKFPTP